MVNASLLELPGGLLGSPGGPLGIPKGSPGGPKRSPFWISLILVDVGSKVVKNVVFLGVGQLLVKEYDVFEPNVPQV